MPARVTIKPAPRLTWAVFESVGSLPNGWWAVTQYGYGHKKYKIERVGDYFAPGDFVVTVTIHKAQVLRAVQGMGTSKQLRELLAHEQGHADLANLGARGIKRAVSSLRVSTSAELAGKITAIEKQQIDRMKRLHDKYDAETKHGADRAQQLRWNGLIAMAKKNSKASTINGVRF